MSMRFGIYLVDHDYITASQFVALVKLQLKQREPLGQTALRLGLLSVEQVYEVLALQSQRKGLSFCDAASQLGLLNASRFSQLMVAQAQKNTSIKELIVKQGWITKARMNQLFEQYQNRTPNSLEASAQPKKKTNFKPSGLNHVHKKKRSIR